MFKRIDHIGLMVPNLDEAVKLYQDCFGVEFTLRERNEEQGYEVAAFMVGDGHVEILAPTRPDSMIARALDKRGAGIHHLGLEVEQIDQALEQVKAYGLTLTRETPGRGTGGSRIAFIHPKSLMGVALELVELPKCHEPD